MRFVISPMTSNPANMMRRAGYAFQHHVDDSEEMSFVRPLAQGGFPRFHVYAQQKGLALEISIHLDQKKETYGKDTRHHGEYADEGALGEEVERLKQALK